MTQLEALAVVLDAAQSYLADAPSDYIESDHGKRIKEAIEQVEFAFFPRCSNELTSTNIEKEFLYE